MQVDIVFQDSMTEASWSFDSQYIVRCGASSTEKAVPGGNLSLSRFAFLGWRVRFLYACVVEAFVSETLTW